MPMTLSRKRQAELHNTIFPAIKGRVLNKKEKMVKDFSRRKNIINDEKFPSGFQVIMVDKTRTSKWDPVYEGPFTLVRKNRGGAYVLRDLLGELKRKVPADQLKLVKRDGINPAVDEAKTQEVKTITNHRSERNRKMSYYVVWKDATVDPC
eukprot:IDg9331t1